MTNKELLELAAKAAGYKLVQGNGTPQERDLYIELYDAAGFASYPHWNPLEKDGDALRLAVKLCILNKHEIGIAPINVWHGDDSYAATRRAIVRAAAEIGKTL